MFDVSFLLKRVSVCLSDGQMLFDQSGSSIHPSFPAPHEHLIPCNITQRVCSGIYFRSSQRCPAVRWDIFKMPSVKINGQKRVMKPERGGTPISRASCRNNQSEEETGDRRGHMTNRERNRAKQSQRSRKYTAESGPEKAWQIHHCVSSHRPSAATDSSSLPRSQHQKRGQRTQSDHC